MRIDDSGCGCDAVAVDGVAVCGATGVAFFVAGGRRRPCQSAAVVVSGEPIKAALPAWAEPPVDPRPAPAPDPRRCGNVPAPRLPILRGGTGCFRHDTFSCRVHGEILGAKCGDRGGCLDFAALPADEVDDADEQG